ncbi:MAG: flagellar biosynthetic protein FliO, partial [Rhodoferax sp.]
DGNGQSRFISALAVGPHQRVVTVEVGPEGKRVWLTLGVTSQNITCLHCVDADALLPTAETVGRESH